MRSTVAAAGLSYRTAPDHWQEQGLCAQVGWAAFFPEKGEPAEAAKRICAGCGVRAECLEYALTERIAEGVWGGTTERERRKIRRQRRRTPTQRQGERANPTEKETDVLHDLTLRKRGREVEKFTAEVDPNNGGRLQELLVAAVIRNNDRVDRNLGDYSLDVRERGERILLFTYASAPEGR